jgi:hypothetical protein
VGSGEFGGFESSYSFDVAGRADEHQDVAPLGRFVHDLRRAVRICIRDPRLPLLSIGYAMFARVWSALADSTGNHAFTWGWIFSLLFVGVYGVERVWFVSVDRGLSFSWFDARELTWELWGRFFRLGLLMTLATVPTVVLALAVLGAGWPRTAVVLGIGLCLDFLLTFATPCLAFNDVTAPRAVAHSFRVARNEWPASRWYVLAAPLGILLASQFLPSHSLGFVPALLLGFVLASFALLCKGATVLFYADRYPTLDELRDPTEVRDPK